MKFPSLLRLILTGTLCWSYAFNSPGAERATFSARAASDWVELSPWSATEPRPENSTTEGVSYLTYELQDHPQNEERFIRVVMLMQNETGVQDAGNINIAFNPAYQELVFHMVQVHRDGKIINMLNLDNIQLIQPEPELGSHLFTGRKNAVIFIEDLRVGDVLEYSYTLHGANPVMNGHYASTFYLRNSIPIGHQRFRVLWPEDRPLHSHRHETWIDPEQTTHDGITEYCWDIPWKPAIPYEDNVPESFEYSPFVELSDYASWNDVVQWALPLYREEENQLPDDLSQLIQTWKNSTDSPAEQALLALHFVQDDVRYTGIEMGESAYRPAHPFKTFQMRYGDCKGKSVLLCVMLREMGIQAYPALVHSGLRQNITNHLPSPSIFNHVIVKLELNGQIFWLDTTRSHQGGPIDKHYLPDFKKALVIQHGVNALEDIPEAPAISGQQNTSVFRLTDYDSPVSLTMRSTCRGWEADNMRAYFARVDCEEITKTYLNYLTHFHPDAEADQPVQFIDDREANELTFIESYTLYNFWEETADQCWEATFAADLLNKLLPEPDVRVREMPLAIPYPIWRKQTIEVHLPDNEWEIPNKEQHIDSPAFTFSYHRSFSNQVMTLDYECRTKTSEIPATSVGNYLRQVNKMQDLLFRTLYRNEDQTENTEPSADSINILMLIIAGLGILLSGGILRWIWRTFCTRRTRSPQPHTTLPERPACRIGGWLILVAIGICLAPLTQLFSIGSAWSNYFSLNLWQNLCIPTGELYHPLAGFLFCFEMLGNIWFIEFSILIIFLFFKKRKNFPMLFIFHRITLLLFLIADAVLAYLILKTSDTSNYSTIIQAFIGAVIWCIYMLVSRRVKKTFVK